MTTRIMAAQRTRVCAEVVIADSPCPDPYRAVKSDELRPRVWEARCAEALRTHAGRPPNAHLTSELGGLAPGRALDAGRGHGSDALWLASRGRQVTGVDFAATALAAARSLVPGAELDRGRATACDGCGPPAGRSSSSATTVESARAALDPARWELVVAVTRAVNGQTG